MENEKDLEQKTTDTATVSNDRAERKASEKGEKRTFLTWFNEVKAEFFKIIWPSKAQLVKETTTVIFTTLLFGVIIYVMNMVLSWGYQLFLMLTAAKG